MADLYNPSAGGVTTGIAKVFNVKDYGAKGDTVTVTDGAITTGTAGFTSATAGFVATDVGKTVSITGAGLAGIGFRSTISTYVSATSVTLSANASVTVTGAVSYFGTDDTAVLQSTVNLAVVSSGAVFIPIGRYTVSSRIKVLGSNISIDGAGAGATTLILAAEANQEIFLIGNGNVGDAAAGDGATIIPTNCVFISKMTLDGTRLNQNAATLYGPSGTRNLLRFRSDAQTSYYGVVAQVEAKNSKQNGMSFESNNFGTARECFAHDNAGFGIWWENGSICNLTNNTTQQNDMAGIKVYAAGNGSVTGNISKSDFGASIAMQSVNSVAVVGNTAYRPGWRTTGTAVSAGIGMSACVDMTITGNTVFGSYGNGFEINGTTRSTFIGNTFRRCGQQTDATYSDILLTNTGGGSAVLDCIFADNVFHNDNPAFFSNRAAYNISTNSVNQHLGNSFFNNVFGEPATAKINSLISTDPTALTDDSAIGQNRNLNPHKYYNLGNVAATANMDFANGDTQSMVLPQNTTITLNNGIFKGQNVSALVRQDATGSRIVTWGGSVSWSGNTAPVLATAANALNAIVFTWDGGSWIGLTSGSGGSSFNGGTITGNLIVSKSVPEHRLISADAAFTRVNRADTGDIVTRYNQVMVPAGSPYALSFNGTTQSVTASSTLTAIDNWGLSVWVKPSSINQLGAIVDVGNASTGYGLYIGDGAGGVGAKIAGLYNSVAWVSSSTSFVNTTAWVHIVMTRQSGTLKFYINGTLDANTFVTVPVAPAATFAIGQETGTSGARFFAGAVDEVQVYNRALTATDVAALYNGGAGIYVATGTSLVAGYHMDEGSGTTTADFSGSALTGTLNASPTWSAGKVTPTGTLGEYPVWSSSDGLSGSEQGIHTWGSPSGGAKIQGQTVKNYTNGLLRTQIDVNGVFYPFSATTASAPAYVKGGIYFDTTLNKLRVGGATAWETITSA